MQAPAAAHTSCEDGNPRPCAEEDVFMCILRFHARAGYLQHYETLLKEIQLHPTSDAPQEELVDQYDVE